MKKKPKVLRPISRRNAARIRALVDCCGAAQQWDSLCLFPGRNPKTGQPFAGLTAELDMLLRGFKPVITCKEVP